MKQLLSLSIFLLPCLAFAQYPSNGNQKITLGEQTTADGLIWRGVAADTTLTVKSDTAAYFVLDTVNKKLYFYKISSTPKWNEISGSGGGGSTIDTATMLLPYYRAGRTGIIQVSDVPTLNQNTTGSAATLTTSRTFQTNLASTSTASFNGSANVTPGITGTLGAGNGGTGATTFGAVNNIPFTSSSGSLTTDNNFVYNTTNDRLGIGTASPSYTLDVNGTGSFKDSIFLGNVVIGKTKQNNNSIRFGINSGLSTGDKNVAIGTNTLQNDTGGENTAIGFEAGKNLTTGLRNMLLGSFAGSKMTNGGSTVAIGATALFNSTSPGEVVAIGRAAMEQSLSGDRITAIGTAALYRNNGGNDNTAIGFRAGWANSANNNTTGSNNTFIGNEAVGASAAVSNVITLGNSSIATIRAQVTTITSLSDIRDKTNITPLNYGIDFIKKLNPVSFDWDMRDGGKIGISEIGFIAQELQQAQIDSQINIPNLVSDINPDKLEASYGVLIPIIVKALKEQQALIDELKQKILNLENK